MKALDAAVRAVREAEDKSPLSLDDCADMFARAALRAALPAEPPSALMSAIHMAIENETGIQINTPISQIIWRMVRAHLLGDDA